jgi:hypothetical protein
VACGEIEFCPVPDFTVAGLDICTNGLEISPQEIETITELAERHTNFYYPEVVNVVDRFEEWGSLKVEFIDSDLSVDCEHIGDTVYKCKHHIGGATASFRRIYIEYYECLAHTSLDHELLHVIDYLYLNGPRGNTGHATEHLFTQAVEDFIDKKEAVEYKIYLEARSILPSCQ